MTFHLIFFGNTGMPLCLVQMFWNRFCQNSRHQRIKSARIALFSVLKVSFMTPGEDAALMYYFAAQRPVCVLRIAFWRRRFTQECAWLFINIQLCYVDENELCYLLLRPISVAFCWSLSADCWAPCSGKGTVLKGDHTLWTVTDISNKFLDFMYLCGGICDLESTS